MSATKIDEQTTRMRTPDGRYRFTTIQRLHDMGVQSDTPPDTPDVPPVTDRMVYGGNFPMQFGWSTERFEIRGDGTLDPAFVNDMRVFEWARYMECMRTNRSPDVTVEDMEVPKAVWDAWPDGSGVPISYVAQHARLLGVRPWVNVPHLGDNNLVVHMATECLGLRPIVEVSNELHNTSDKMTQSLYAAEQSGVPFSSGPEQRQAAYAWAAMRLLKIQKLWRSIDPEAQFVFAMSQNDPPFDPALYAPFDAIAPNAYFGQQINWDSHRHHKQDNPAQLADWLGGEAIDMMLEQIAARVAEADGKPVWPYEGGPHVWSDGRGNPAILEVLKDPVAEYIYRRYLTGLEAVGCGAVMHYMTCQSRNTNPFGLKEYTGQDESEVGAYRAFIR